MRVYRIPAPLECLIFDIDSTLYTHAEYAHEQVDVQIRHFASLKNISANEARVMVENKRKELSAAQGKKQSLGNTLVEFGIPIEESVRWRENLLEPAEYLSKDPLLIKTLSLLAARYRLVAVTNNPVLPAAKTLTALGVRDFFPNLIGLDTTGVSKPHRLPFLKAAELAGVPCERCLSVGDRYDIDIALPLELGMGGILVDGVEDVYGLASLLFAGPYVKGV